MATFSLTKARGLYSLINKLEMPPGALVTAQNIFINRDNIIEPRRGFKVYGETGANAIDLAKQLFVYKTRILAHYNSVLAFDDGSGTFTDFTGSFPDTETGLRAKGIEANGNFYFTSSSGVKKISVKTAPDFTSATVSNAGGVKALDLEAAINSDIGFFSQDSVVGYRVVWGIKDANDNLILGAPSQRAIVYNPITSLLVNDYNNLVLALEPYHTNTDGYKIPKNSTASTLKTNLVRFKDDIDVVSALSDIYPEEPISVSITANIASVQFSGDISDKLVVGDVILFNGFTGTTVSLNGRHTILSVSTDTITFYHYTTTLAAVDTTISPNEWSITGVIKRLKYSLAPFRTNDVEPISLNVTGVSLQANNLYIRFSSSVVNLIRPKDTITISGLSGTLEELNGTYDTSGLLYQTVSNDTIQMSLIHNDVALNTTECLNGRVQIESSENLLPVSTSATTDQLEGLQSLYDDVVDELINDPLNAEEVSNSTTSATVDLTFTVPQNITTAHFYQIYRTTVVSSEGVTSLFDTGLGEALTPGDEMGLVYEANPTTDEIATGYIEVQDVTPDSLRGANLYINPNSGEGEGQSNELPPSAKDIASYKGFTFYSNTETKQRKNLTLLSVSKFVDATSTLTISNGTTSNTYTFVSPVSEVSKITLTGSETNTSTNGKYFLLDSTENSYYVWFNKGGTATDPAITGRTGVEVDTTFSFSYIVLKNELAKLLDFNITYDVNEITITNAIAGVCTNITDGDTGFTFETLTQGKGEDIANKKVLFTPTSVDATISPSQQVDETARSLVRNINRNSNELVYAFYISKVDGLPGEILLEARGIGVPFYLTVDSFSTSTTVTPNTGSQFNPALPISGTSVISASEVTPNRVYYSKNQQPEAVPLLNYQDVGPKDQKILRIIALRDSLFIFKEEAIYRLSGESAPFIVTVFDKSTILKAPDSAAVLNNQIYIYSSQGVATISDTGVAIISRPIENLLIKLQQYTNFKAATFGVGYESDRSYYLFTVSATSDTKATQCFRFNTFTNTWSILDLSKTCGIVNPQDDLLYLGAGDLNYVEVERKNYDRTDHADREIEIEIQTDSVLATTFEIITPSINAIGVGDVIIQTQYLTINKFNLLLRTLDLDDGLIAEDFESSLEAEAGNNLRSNLVALAQKLDTELGSGTYYDAEFIALTDSFVDLQTAFNLIVDKLNLEETLSISNYQRSTGTVDLEVVITDIDTNTLLLTTRYAFPFIAGPSLVYKKIETEIIWAPQYFDDVSVGKHIREASILFEDSSYTSAIVAYSTDISPSYVEVDAIGTGTGVDVIGTGPGFFGSDLFGANNFGGDGTSVPFRTLPSRDKQRCRYINTKFMHEVAREKYSIYGISFTYELFSSRLYK